MSTLDQINSDLKAAMLAKDNATRDTLRMLISEIKRYEIDNRVDADDSVVLATLKKMIKQRKDSIEQFDKGGRADLSEIEKNELLVLDKYMPEMMSEEAINELVTKTISELGASGPSACGAAAAPRGRRARHRRPRAARAPSPSAAHSSAFVGLGRLLVGTRQMRSASFLRPGRLGTAAEQANGQLHTAERAARVAAARG